MGIGGVDNSQQQLQLAENQKTLDLIERQTTRASRDMGKLFGSAEQNTLAGNEAAMGLMGQYVPQQFGALQQGNVSAQEQLLAGLPQMQNALLGMPVDYSGLQPKTFGADTSYMQTQMPQFQTSQQALGQTAPEQAQEQQFSVDQELARLPTFVKQDLQFAGMDVGVQKMAELADQIKQLTPEARAQLMQAGPGQVGLGGNRGSNMFDAAMAGRTINPLSGMKTKGGF